MKDAVIIYPHQLFADSPALAGDFPVYLVEEPLFFTHNPIHRQKLLLHKLAMDAYETYLKEAGHDVTRLTIVEHGTTEMVFARIKRDGVERMHIVDTTDDYLEQAIAQSGLERVWYESPLFLLTKADAVKRYQDAKQFMASFYKQMRIDFNVLLTADGKPVGGKWSFDADNRKKVPRGTVLPEDIAPFANEAVSEAVAWVETVPAEKYGECIVWIPYTHTEAQKFLQEFLRLRLTNFGQYEDAITTTHTRLWHSTLSPLLNIGLLTPQQVLTETLRFAEAHEVPLNSLEGFVRQLIGWREFIRASYEHHGRAMRSANFFNHTRPLPEGVWDGTTTILPVDHTITTALRFGYTHHIERLMVMGNFLLLTKTRPHEVYRWFMAMYVDAYDWVMVPNVYGMSQFADGGGFATKPYISGANYIKKMSDYESGDWEATWTGLYWHFIDTHKEFFLSNHRLSMMSRLLENMSPVVRTAHLNAAKDYLG